MGENGHNPPINMIKNDTKKDSTTEAYEGKEIYIATYNTRTLRTEEHMVELENALTKIKWDILGLSEVRRFGEQIVERRDGSIFAYVGETKGLYGVGFIINKRWKNNIIEIKAFGERLIGLKIKIGTTKLSIIQVYAPTEKATDEDVEKWYKMLDKTTEHFRSEIMLVIGDFNSKIGISKPGESQVIGPFGYGVRNKRGERLVQWLWQQQFMAGNSIFKKKARKTMDLAITSRQIY